MMSPVGWETIAGVVTIAATATDEGPVARLQFRERGESGAEAR